MPITVVGHPFAPIGMGEQMRSHLAAMEAMHLHHRVLDIFRHAERGDDLHHTAVGDREIVSPPGGIRIFHVNGDEATRAIAAFAERGGEFSAGLNVIVPAWELPRFPAAWVPAVRRFDAVWAISRFVQASLAGAGIDSHVVGQAVGPPAGPLLPRRWFGLRESALVLLHMLDLGSYPARKNPGAVLELFARLRAARPAADMQLVLKAKEGNRPAAGWAAGIPAQPGLRLLDQPLDTQGVHSLIAASDIVVSLHRAEGFGRGLAEAMAAGRLAVGTGWSGNLDFMAAEHCVLVPHRPVPVGAHYPHGRGQRWAEPDVAWACEALLPLIDDPAARAARAARGRSAVLRSHGARAVGLRIVEALQRLLTLRPLPC